MDQGIVVKIHSNYYYVVRENQAIITVGQIECFLRGRFKKQRIQVMVGDRVRFTLTGENTGVIEEILPRESQLRRPPVANLSQVIIVFSLVNPDPNWLLFDRFLILAEQAKLEILICFNKVDLVEKEEWIAENQVDIYEKIGYKVIYCSTKKNIGIGELKNSLQGKISVFAGPSGVGKSALLNTIQPGLQLKTGELSEKIQRGKHTTRHVELIKLQSGGLVVDAPGFSHLTLENLEKEELASLFPEIDEAAYSCRYSPCFHWKENDCQVKKLVEAGTISSRRYEHYLRLLGEITEKRGGKR